jgi:N6-adenosine-specific RNA methylase IME4
MPALVCRIYFFYEKAMSVAYVRQMLNEDLGIQSNCSDMYGYQVQATETWLKTTTTTTTTSSRQQEYVAASQSIACYISHGSRPPLCTQKA